VDRAAPARFLTPGVSTRTVILSDTHLGRPRGVARSAEALRPLWRGAEHLVINGDVAEIHHPLHRPAAAREVLRMAEMCEEDGVALTLLSGNHDPYITDHRHLHLAGDAVFVTHGDVLHPAIAPWSPAAARLRVAHEEALESIHPDRRDELDARLAAAQHASHAEWEQLTEEAGHSSMAAMFVRPWTLLLVLSYWYRLPRIAARFAATHVPRARFIVLGHTHHPGIWRVGERVIINTGSYGFPGSPRAVLVDDDTLTVRRIVMAGDAYRLDREVASFPLR
jgi:predicted phosphodiesterase